MNPDFFDINEPLLEELNRVGMYSDSKLRLYKNKQALVLNENYKKKDTANAPRRTPTEYEYNGVSFSWNYFKEIYTNYEKYPTRYDIMQALGLPRPMFSTKRNYEETMNRIIRHFREKNREGAEILVSLSDREEAYYSDSIPEASTNKINQGKKGQRRASTPVVDMLNGQAVVPGEFYSDISRIPKRKWGNWVRFWERQVSRIKNPKSILGRVWSKTFIMGYQFQRKVVVEIWYNSATSDFSVYDQNGGELGRATKTLQESIRLFVTYLVREYSSDKEIFQSQGDASQLAKSYMSAIKRGAKRDAIEADREAKLAAKEQKNKGNVQNSISGAVKAGTQANVQSHADADARRKKASPGNADADPSRGNSRQDEDNKRQQEKSDRGWAENPNEHTGSGNIEKKMKDAINKARKAKGFEEVSPEEYKAKYNFNQREEEIKKRAQQQRDDSERAKNNYMQRTGGTAQSIGRDDVVYTSGDKTNPSSNTKQKGMYDPFVYANQGINANQVTQLRTKYMDLKAEYEAETQEVARQEREARDVQKTEAGNKRKKILKDDILASRTQALRLKRQMEDAKKELKKLGDDPSSNNQLRIAEAVKDFTEFEFDAASQELDREAVSRRKAAEQSGFTTSAIRTSTMTELLSVYNETRVNPKGMNTFSRFILNRLKVFRGRRARLELPKERAPVIDRMRMALMGASYRADFVIGFSLKDAINIEVWYVTEPDSDQYNKTISSFYVYDVTSATVVRANLPYYRSAVQVAMAKIGVS
jgi:hypothetical protein